MIKKSQQQFKNPERQALDEKKQNLFKAKKMWNARMKEFREELKKIQGLVNGRAEGKERIKLYEPLPEETQPLLTDLTSNFQKRVDESNLIVDYQKNYSQEYDNFYSRLEAKRQDMLKRPAPQIKNTSKKASTDSFDYNLISEGIGPMGMAWESVKSVFTGKRISYMRQLYHLNQVMSEIELELLNARTTDDIKKIEAKCHEVYRTARGIYGSIKLKLEKSKVLDGAAEKTNIDLEDHRLTNIRFIRDEVFSQFPFWEMENKETPDFSSILSLRKSIIKNLEKLSNAKDDDDIDIIIRDIKAQYAKLRQDSLKGSHHSFKDYNKERNKISQSSFNYGVFVKYAQDNPHDSIFMKFKKFLSRLGLNAKPFFDIKDNLKSAADSIKSIRSEIAGSIECLKNSGSDPSSQEDVFSDTILNSLKNVMTYSSEIIREMGYLQNTITESKVTPEQVQTISKVELSQKIKDLKKRIG
jgi:hypothetical protein